MMKYAAIIAAVLVLFLIACQPAAPAAPAAPAPQPAAPAEQPPAAVEPGPTPVETKPEPAVSKELQDLLSKADQRVKSYKYLELILPDKKQPDTIYVKGSRIKIKLYEYDPYVPENYFDTVYLETSTKTAVGRCESNKRCVWRNGDNTKKDFPVSYDKYLPKTPYQMLKDIPATATVLGPEVHESRETTKVQYGMGDKTVTAWIDVSYGIPLEMREEPAGKTYKFNDVLFNTIKDEDVTPPKIS
jgi:hypothetical protein